MDRQQIHEKRTYQREKKENKELSVTHLDRRKAGDFKRNSSKKKKRVWWFWTVALGRRGKKGSKKSGASHEWKQRRGGKGENRGEKARNLQAAKGVLI